MLRISLRVLGHGFVYCIWWRLKATTTTQTTTTLTERPCRPYRANNNSNQLTSWTTFKFSELNDDDNNNIKSKTTTATNNKMQYAKCRAQNERKRVVKRKSLSEIKNQKSRIWRSNGSHRWRHIVSQCRLFIAFANLFHNAAKQGN